MQELLVVFTPAVLMVFALAMQRLEAHLGKPGPREDEVEAFLLHASPKEMNTLAHEGLAEALDIFDGRQERAKAANSA
jgi:hypothetical protein